VNGCNGFILGSLNTYDIINQVLMEKLMMNQKIDEDMDVETSQGGNLSLDIMDTSERAISPSKKQVETDMAASPSSDHSSPVNVMLSYLIKCYDRVIKEEKTMSKVLDIIYGAYVGVCVCVFVCLHTYIPYLLDLWRIFE